MNVILESFIKSKPYPRVKPQSVIGQNDIESSIFFQSARRNGLQEVNVSSSLPKGINAVTAVIRDQIKRHSSITLDPEAAKSRRVLFEEIAHANQSVPTLIELKTLPLEKLLAKRLFFEISAKSTANAKTNGSKYGAVLKEIRKDSNEGNYNNAIFTAVDFLKSKGYSNKAIQQLFERTILDIQESQNGKIVQTYFSNGDVPQGYFTKDDISQWLGFKEYNDPEKLWASVPHGISATYNDVKRVKAPKCEFIIKPSSKGALSIDFSDVFETMPRIDMLMRGLIKTIYKDVFEVPDAKLFLNDEKIPFTASVYLPNLQEDLTLYQSGDEKFRVPLSIIHLDLGLEDLAPNNYLRAESGKPAIIDCDMIKNDRLQKVTISKAKTQIATNYAPLVMSNGGNVLQPYLEENKRIRELFFDNSNVIEQIMNAHGLKEDEKSTYLNTIRGDTDLYEENMSTFVAIANGTLPSHMLNKIGWHGNSEPKLKEEIKGAVTFNLNKGDEALFQTGDCSYLHIFKKNNTDITVQTYYDEDIVQKTVSSGAFSLGNGSEEETDFIIEEGSIAPKHLHIEINNGNKVKLTKLDPDFMVQMLA